MQPITEPVVLYPWQSGMFSLIVYILAVLGLIAVLLFLAAWAGIRRPNREKLRPYESGIIPTGSARLRYPVPFFMVAVFFLIFDVEAAFILSWAVAGKTLSWPGWIEITFFIAVLIIGLIYIWRKGGLQWGPTTKKR